MSGAGSLLCRLSAEAGAAEGGLVAAGRSVQAVAVMRECTGLPQFGLQSYWDKNSEQALIEGACRIYGPLCLSGGFSKLLTWRQPFFWTYAGSGDPQGS